MTKTLMNAALTAGEAKAFGTFVCTTCAKPRAILGSHEILQANGRKRLVCAICYGRRQFARKGG